MSSDTQTHEQNHEQTHEHERASRELASRFLECFSSDAGQFVLDRLKTITLERPVLNGSSTQFSAGIREGQHDLVRQIMSQIKLAKGEKNG
jgi:hypothetical protein